MVLNRLPHHPAQCCHQPERPHHWPHRWARRRGNVQNDQNHPIRNYPPPSAYRRSLPPHSIWLLSRKWRSRRSEVLLPRPCEPRGGYHAGSTGNTRDGHGGKKCRRGVSQTQERRESLCPFTPCSYALPGRERPRCIRRFPHGPHIHLAFVPFEELNWKH